MQHSSDEPLRAGLLRRLAAFFYDSLLLIAVYFAIGGVAVAINRGESIPTHWSMAVALLIFPLAAFSFYCWFWRRCWQTLGMQAWRIKLVADTTPPSFRLCTVRFLVSLLSVAALGLGFWWMLVDRNKRTWQDIASGSHIVRLPKP